MSTLTHDAETIISVDLEPGEANAIVYTVALALTTEAEHLESMPVSTSPGDLCRVADRADRIARLAQVGEQLKWRAHWGDIGGEPPAITITEAVLLELSSALLECVDEYEDEAEIREFPFARAARTLARTFAGSEA